MTAQWLRADIGLRRGDFDVGIAFSVEPGRTAALLGPNGAGKTTAIEAIAGLARLDSGRINLGATTFDAPNDGEFLAAEKRSVGVVFQDDRLFPNMTVLDNIAFGPRCRGSGRRKARRSADEWLDRVSLEGFGDRRPADLSGGEAQRVALARALASEPELLLLDEPLAAVDASARLDLRRRLSDHLDEFEGPAVLVTHDPTEAFLLADTIHVVENGAVVQTGSPDEIRLRPQTRYVADLVGMNLFQGTADKGSVTIGGHRLHIADTSMTGAVLVKLHPRAVSIHRLQPEGSPRNTWETTITRVEHYGDRVRLQFAVPLELTAEITPAAEQVMGLAAGSVVWLSVKATEIDAEPT